MRVGFTGTRRGMTHTQLQLFGQLLSIVPYSHWQGLHHGDCVGADAQAWRIAYGLGWYTVAHPPADQSLRAFTASSYCWQPRPYLERDRALVDATDALIAAPYGVQEELRSGTWTTVRYARKTGKLVIIIEPDGRLRGPPGSWSYFDRLCPQPNETPA